MTKQNSKKLLRKLTSKMDDAKKNSIGKAKAITDGILSTTSQFSSKESLEKYMALMNKASASTWKYVSDTPAIAVEKYKNMSKAHKVLAISAMAGGAIVSMPFILAAGSVSIVSALATLGLGTLSAGGYGVAGGIVVTAGGSALTASLAGAAANKFIEDPEINELIDSYGKLEELIKQNFQTMEKNQARFKLLYGKYSQIADFVAELQETINKGKEYDIEQVRDRNNRVKYIIEDFTSELAQGAK